MVCTTNVTHLPALQGTESHCFENCLDEVIAGGETMHCLTPQMTACTCACLWRPAVFCPAQHSTGPAPQLDLELTLHFAGVRISFQAWDSPNGTTDQRGQFPELYIRPIEAAVPDAS